MMRHLLLILVALLSVCVSVCAQTVRNGNYQTIAYIKSDGTIQDSNYKTVGYVKSDGTVQDSSYRTIGHADGIPLQWAAFYFFFFR